MTQQPRRGIASRALAVVSASALALTGILALSGTAASASTGDIVAPPNGGSIIVHKHAGTPGAAGTGEEITGDAALAALGIGVGNVPFKLERVTYSGSPIDLSTVEGWSHITDTMTPADITGLYGTQVEVASQDTNPSGVTTFGGLELGLYLVTELPGGPGVAEVAPPFLVTVPHTNAVDASWLYDVHVYPKNRLTDITSKTVSEPSALVAGSTVTWTITASVPRPATGNTYTVFTITDNLDPRLTFVSATVKRDGVLLDPSVVSVVGQMVTVTPPIAGVQTGQFYVVEIVTSVNGSGVIPNTAVRNVNGVTSDIGPANTNWGEVQVLKQQTGTSATLQGAKFELWTGEANVGDRTKVLDEQTTDANGVITFGQVWLGNGTTKTAVYCLKETQAPVGHSIANEWTCVTLNAEAAVDGLPAATVLQAVDNPRRTTPNLPLTGAAGTALFMAGGLALIVAAAGAALMVSRRRSNSMTGH